MFKFFSYAAISLTGFVILFFVVRIVGLDEIAKGFSGFSWWGVAPLLLFTFANHYMAAVKWQYILRVMGVRINIVPLTKIWFMGYSVSYLTPVAYIGGEVFRAYALKDKFGVPWGKSLSSIGIDKVMESSVWISTILIGSFVFLYQTGISSFSKVVVFGGISAIFFLLVIFVIYVFSFKNISLLRPLLIKPFRLEGSKSEKFLSDLERDFFNFFSLKNKRQILASLNFAIIKSILLWLRNVFLIYYLVGIFDYSAGLVSLASSYISYSVPIPASLGAHEGFMAFIFANTGFTAGTGAVFTLLMRGADAILVSVGLLYLFKWGIGLFALKIFKGNKATKIFLNGENSQNNN